MARARHARVVVLASLVLFATIAAACGTSTPTTTGTASTTTTTTTLPLPVEILGTDPSGPLASMGPIFRVPVEPVPNGALVSPTLSVAQAFASRVKIGFRQIGSGPNLLLIMGEHGTMSWWDPQLITALAANFKVTIFDLPGVGYSQSTGGRPSLSALADTTAGFIDALGLGNPIVLGWGLGGQIALALAERHHGLVGALVLADTSAGGADSIAPDAAVSGLFRAPDATLGELSQAMYPVGAEVDRVAWLGRIAELSPDDIVANGVHEEAALESSLAPNASILDNLGAIHLPTLVIFGALDEVFPARNAGVLLQKVRHARKLEFTDAGYAALFQHPQDVASAIDTLAATLPPQTTLP